MSAPWDLPAPESAALLRGIDAASGEPLRVALLELIVRRRLRVDRRGRRGRDVALVPLEGGREPEADSVRVVDALLHEGGGELTRADLGAKAAAAWGEQGGYTYAVVAPALQAAGLAERQERRALGVFRVVRWPRTSAGEAARDRLRAHLDALGSAGERPDLTALVAGAGAAVLLAPDVWPLLQRLGGGAGGDVGGPVPYFGAADLAGGEPGDAGAPGDLPLDFGGLDSALDFGDLSGFGDAGGGGDGGGGDGGGGDGGGGGGGAS